ncbi:MAG TPA: hypothetical protein VNZ85_03225, partial [Caulobacter sp.]|nr:hypothetical protein [Caulobacter sp.]
MTTPPDRRLVFLLNVAHRRVQRYVEAKMAAKGGLTAAQSGALFVLGQKDGALIGEAAEALDLAPGLSWLRMPLPFALDHINLWLLDDAAEGKRGWSLVDCGA